MVISSPKMAEVIGFENSLLSIFKTYKISEGKLFWRLLYTTHCLYSRFLQFSLWASGKYSCLQSSRGASVIPHPTWTAFSAFLAMRQYCSLPYPTHSVMGVELGFVFASTYNIIWYSWAGSVCPVGYCLKLPLVYLCVPAAFLSWTCWSPILLVSCCCLLSEACVFGQLVKFCLSVSQR